MHMQSLFVVSLVLVLSQAQILESDPPSSVPSYSPAPSTSEFPTLSRSDMPSSVPSIAIVPQTASPSQQGLTICSTLNCKRYATMTALQDAIRSSPSGRSICMCPHTYSPETDTCADTIVIDRTIRLECAAVGSDRECYFGCSNTLFEVQKEAKLEFLGHRKTILTGGTTQSRIYVATNGTLDIYGVNFVDTSAIFPKAQERRLEEVQGSSTSSGQGSMNSENDKRHLQASGEGAGIFNMGTINMLQVNFFNCTAARGGGGLWSNGDAKISRCRFVDNKALSGGAIYVEGGSFFMLKSFFSRNTATMGSAHVFWNDDATMDGCGNSGLDAESPLVEPCREPSAAAGWLSLQAVLALAALVSWIFSC